MEILNSAAGNGLQKLDFFNFQIKFWGNSKKHGNKNTQSLFNANRGKQFY